MCLLRLVSQSFFFIIIDVKGQPKVSDLDGVSVGTRIVKIPVPETVGVSTLPFRYRPTDLTNGSEASRPLVTDPQSQGRGVGLRRGGAGQT